MNKKYMKIKSLKPFASLFAKTKTVRESWILALHDPAFLLFFIVTTILWIKRLFL